MVSHKLAAIIAISVVIPLSIITVSITAESARQFQSTDYKSKFVILTTFYPIYEFTTKVAGDKLDVSQLTPSGVEPHDWEPTFNEFQRIHQSDAIIINGLGFENWLDQVQNVNPDLKIIDSSVGILSINEEKKTIVNSHIWLNPIMAKKQVENILDGLIEIDPSNAEYYRNNANLYNQELSNLDEKIRNILSQCQKKDFISFHNSFYHFASEYSLNQHVIIDSNDPHGEPTSKTLERIISLARDHNIKVIFTEEAVDPRISQVIADEIGGSVMLLSPLEVSEEASYIQKMLQNISNMKEALCN